MSVPAQKTPLAFSSLEEVSLPVKIRSRPIGADETALVWVRDLRGTRHPLITKDQRGILRWTLSFEELLENCRQMHGREPQRPFYTYVPGFDVYRIPASLRKVCLKSFFLSHDVKEIVSQGSAIDRLINLLAQLDLSVSELNQFKACAWPQRKKASFIITLDVDSNYVFRDPNNRIRRLLREKNLKAAWYFVTGRYPLEPGFLSDLEREGHEIGWHTHRHDHSLAFLPKPKMEKLVQLAVPFFEKYSVTGMRCDNFLWSRDLFEVVSRHLKYDTSFHNAYPNAERGLGCETSAPFLMESGLWQLPTTLSVDLFFPDDWSLARKRELMIEQIDKIIESRGLAHLLIHPEPTISLAESNFSLLQEVLSHVEARRSDLWCALPREVHQHAEAERLARRSELDQVSEMARKSTGTSAPTDKELGLR